MLHHENKYCLFTELWSPVFLLLSVVQNSMYVFNGIQMFVAMFKKNPSPVSEPAKSSSQSPHLFL